MINDSENSYKAYLIYNIIKIDSKCKSTNTNKSINANKLCTIYAPIKYIDTLIPQLNLNFNMQIPMSIALITITIIIIIGVIIIVR